MQIVINIPEKEFGIDIEDRFQDFFSRLKAETKEHLINNTNLVCGAYELETIDMFLKAFNNGTPLPKGHGELVDYEELKNNAREYGAYVETIFSHIKSKTIIEADEVEE